ncbi:MAG: hypothetical protein AAFP69_17190, partial [Planctomycetota bacterium]
TSRSQMNAGRHRVRVEYFECAGGEEIRVQVASGSTTKTDLANVVTLADLKRDDAKIDPAEIVQFQAHPKLVSSGRDAFTRRGCAACHARTGVTPTTQKSLADCKSGAGCVSATPPKNVPDFWLSSVQRSAIDAYLESLDSTKATDQEPAEIQKDRVHLTLAAMNCFACHKRGTVGGPTTTRDPWFKTNTKEMGEEGRLPPMLTGAGDKLNDTYLRQIFANGANERPYMQTRMPGFGEGCLDQIQSDLASLDRQTTADIPRNDDKAEDIVAAGRELVGSKGLSCIKCHSYGGKALPGIEALDMLKMTQRLREDWFHRYLEYPTKYRPGTRMPSSYQPDKKTGKLRSVLTTIYDGHTGKQSDAMWQYLALGRDGKQPVGLNPDAIQLTPATTPILYRNFLTGLTPRGIGVGFPKGETSQPMNLAWDAQRMRLASIWQGEFIDASKHWRGRGPGQQQPMGLAIQTFPKSVRVQRSGDDVDADQSARDRGYRFLGYRLNDQGVPTFRYAIPMDTNGRVIVEERFDPLRTRDGKNAFRVETKLISEDTDSVVSLTIALNENEQLTQVTIDGEKAETKVSSGETQIALPPGKTVLVRGMQR